MLRQPDQEEGIRRTNVILMWLLFVALFVCTALLWGCHVHFHIHQEAPPQAVLEVLDDAGIPQETEER